MTVLIKYNVPISDRLIPKIAAGYYDLALKLPHQHFAENVYPGLFN